MKNKFNSLLYICNVILVGLIIFNIFNFDFVEEEAKISSISIEEGKFISYLLKDNILIDLEKENIKIEVSKEDKKEEVNEEIEIEESNDEKVESNIDFPVIEELIGNLSGYGPDCYGCTSNLTASGRYVGEGNIYYEDSTYGKIRIVAADRAYPFGTIVRISNVDFYNKEPFYAIVLDRGGDIGKNKKFLFDLLFASESEAYQLGKEVNVKYEIVRLGY